VRDGWPIQALPGYPHPIKAGPPGQRQAVIGTKRPAHVDPLLQNVPASPHCILTQPGNFPWAPPDIGPISRPFSSGSAQENNIANTMPIADIARYYPYGLPGDMTELFSFPSQRQLDKNMGIADTRTDEEIRRKTRDDWFYSGVRKVRRDIDAIVNDFAEREAERTYGNTMKPPQSPRPLTGPVLTVDAINKLTLSECAGPLLDGFFGTLLTYADEHYDEPTNKAVMSKWVSSPAWAIDASESGDKSFFGDDFGPAPKRLGRDPRHQFDMEGPRRGL
jgi:hypothetical protein